MAAPPTPPRRASGAPEATDLHPYLKALQTLSETNGDWFSKNVVDPDELLRVALVVENNVERIPNTIRVDGGNQTNRFRAEAEATLESLQATLESLKKKKKLLNTYFPRLSPCCTKRL